MALRKIYVGLVGDKYKTAGLFIVSLKSGSTIKVSVSSPALPAPCTHTHTHLHTHTNYTNHLNYLYIYKSMADVYMTVEEKGKVKPS